MMIIDSHQHYWTTARKDYKFLNPQAGVLYQDYLPRDLKPLLQKFGIGGTIVVQAAATTAETDFILELAGQDETIVGVVGWMDMESPDFQNLLERYRKHPKFVGIRPMIADLPTDWMLRKQVVENFRYCTEIGFAIDFQAGVRHLSMILELLQQEGVGELRAVIDHLAKPPIWDKEMSSWKEQMRQIAQYPNLMCKLSGMVPGRNIQSWSKEEILPYAEHVIDIFGPRRVMYGSDWPVCLLSATYEQVFDLFTACMRKEWSEEEKEAVLGGNAIRFYNLSTL
jgi:L-fuconolactonase